MRIHPILIVTGFLYFVATNTFADSITIDAARDNTIYADNTSNSNGSGDFLFAGQNGGGSPRRSLIQFDFSSIPANAQINNVTLNLFVSQAGANVATSIGLHRLTSDWGESTTDAPGGEGGGAPADIGDATWEFSFFDSVAWSNPGGDFVGGASATTVVDVGGSYSWSSNDMITDIESWISGTNSNFGWLIRGDETTASTSKRFNSRSNGSNNPTLTVDFTVVPEPASSLSLFGIFAVIAFRRPRHSQ